MTDESYTLVIVDPSMENIHYQLIYRKTLRTGNDGSRMDVLLPHLDDPIQLAICALHPRIEAFCSALTLFNTSE